jgi:hypothetical protein
MSPPITVLEINERLLPRNIKMLSNHAITKNKAEFVCKNNHTWYATINSVLSRNGCPKCAAEQIKVANLVTLNTLLYSHGLEMTGEYKGNQKYTYFKCNTCTRTYLDRPIIAKNSGCAYCNGRKTDTATINKKIQEKGLMLTTKCTTTSDYGTFQCAEGHEWSTIISNVVHNKSGCPRCAKYGFNPGLPAYCYVLCYANYIKFGITNDWNRRKAEHLKSKGPFVVGFVRSESNGNNALLWENNIKATFKCGVVDSTICNGGWTETIEVNMLDQLIDLSFTEIYNAEILHKS